MSDAREGGRPGAYRGAGAGAASSYGTRAASGKAGAPSSSEDSLLELLELLLLLIVASECCLYWLRSVPVCRGLGWLPERRCARASVKGPSVEKIGCLLAAYVVVSPRNAAGGVQRHS